MHGMKETQFELDGKTVTAHGDETIWEVAQRQGTTIPHLCHKPAEGYRADGNCRACVVEIEGERVLAASCVRKPAAGMIVKSASKRAETARAGVFELLLADTSLAHDDESTLAGFVEALNLDPTAFDLPEESPHAEPHALGKARPLDTSHPAITVNHDACIQCGLCIRACREVQSNDVIGMAGRGHEARIVFDAELAMAESTCVACGECVQACPTGALMPATRVDADTQEWLGKEDKQVDSLCPFCGVGCQVSYKVQANKIVEANGNPGPANRSRLCVKGRFGYDYTHNPHRLTTPLIRREGAEKQWDMAFDEHHQESLFRPASWDEALDVIAERFRTILAEHGGDAFSGFGSAKGSNEEAYLFQKLIRQAFGTNNVDHCTRLCHASSVAALIEGVSSGAVSAPFTAAEDADCILVIGARPTENHPVAATYFKEAAKRGVELIIADPRRHGLSRFATHPLQFRSGTDVALLNGMLHTIIEEGLTDDNYINGYTTGFAELKAKLAGFAPEKVAEICGIPAERIRAAARAFATAKNSIIFWGMGISQHVHGTDNSRCLISLAGITGHIGRKGTGLHPLRGQNNVQGASDAGLVPMFYPDYQSVENPEIRDKFAAIWQGQGGHMPPLKRGLTVVEIMNSALKKDIRAMYVMGENPAMSDPDLNHARKALTALDFLVVQEIFFTETALHADVILPSSTMYEKQGTFTNSNRQIQMARPVTDTPGDAKQDWWIIQQLALRLGLNWTYETPSAVYAEMASSMPSLANISWERIERENAVTYPCSSADAPGDDIVFSEGFPTADGRMRLVPTELSPPAEEPDEAFPYILTTGRLLEHWHTGAMTRRASTLNALEPENMVHIHPRDMERQGIGTGGEVRVSTRRGDIVLKARRSTDVSPGTLFIPFCFHESPANVLTNPQLDPFGKIPEFKFCAAKIETV